MPSSNSREGISIYLSIDIHRGLAQEGASVGDGSASPWTSMKTKLKISKLSPVRKSLFTKMAKLVCSERKVYRRKYSFFFSRQVLPWQSKSPVNSGKIVYYLSFSYQKKFVGCVRSGSKNVAISGSRPGEACHSVKDMSSCSVSFTGKFLPNFDLKNTILIFHGKIIQIRQVLTIFFFPPSRQIFIMSSLQ